MTVKQVDLKKRYPGLYAARKPAVYLEPPTLKLVALDGEGSPDPTNPDFAGAVTALYQLSYGIRSVLMQSGPQIKYTVMPLEGLWPSTPDGRNTPSQHRSAWRWTILIVQPDELTPETFAEAQDAVLKKQRNDDVARVELRDLDEGPVVQILHTGPYADEGPTLAALKEFADQRGLDLAGTHHEIYLSNPTRVAPSKLKTLLRYPVRPH